MIDKRDTYAGNRLLAKDDNGELFFFHLDRIGSPLMITDVSGNVVKQKKYEAFGNIVWTEGTHDDNREFTGKEKDPTGFHYFGARYYYGNIGRFLSPDPHTVSPGNIDLSNPQELNAYVYCYKNPVSYVDPDGRMGVLAGVMGGAVGETMTVAQMCGVAVVFGAGVFLYVDSYNDYEQTKAIAKSLEKGIDALKSRASEAENAEGDVSESDKSKEKTESKSKFPENMTRKDYKDGEVKKWHDNETGKSKYEWHNDNKGGHYHKNAPDGKGHEAHPVTGDEHIRPDDDVF